MPFYDEPLRAGPEGLDMSDERRRAITSTPRITADEIANRTFSSTFRGVSEAEVKAFLIRVSDELVDASRRESELEAALSQAEIAAANPRDLTEEELLDALGEETGRLLHTARDAARDIRTRAEDNAARLLAEAQESSQQMTDVANGLLADRRTEAETIAAQIREVAETELAELRSTVQRSLDELQAATAAELEALRLDANSEAEAEIARARGNARELVESARELRERVLADLAHRRNLLTEQINELRQGREKLLEAYRIVKRSFLDATEALAVVEGRAASDRPEWVDPGVVDAAIGAVEASEADAVNDDAAEDLAAGADDKSDPVTDDLFARIRAEREARTNTEAAQDETAVDETTADVERAIDLVAETSAEPPVETTAEADQSVATEADIAASAISAVLAKTLKRAKRIVQDDQNAVLDALRRQKGKPDSAAALGDRNTQADSWVGALSDQMTAAYRAGASNAGGKLDTIAADVSRDLVFSVIDPLRSRFSQAIDDSEDADEAIERLNARAREFRTEQLEETVAGLLAGAYANGTYDAAPDAAMLQWIVSAEGCSTDCADNALEPTSKGSEFPTGHVHPPAFAGCRCSLSVTAARVV